VKRTPGIQLAAVAYKLVQLHSQTHMVISGLLDTTYYSFNSLWLGSIITMAVV
jgi:hypothetical protein